jgi:hypothetical protein
MLVIARDVGDNGSEVATGAVSSNGETRGINVELIAMGCNPFGCRPRVVDRCRELGLGSKAIVDRNDNAVGL